MSKSNGNHLNNRIQYPACGTEGMLPGWPGEFYKEAYQNTGKTPNNQLDGQTRLPYSSKDLMYVTDAEEAIDFIHLDGSPVELGTAIGIDIDTGNAVQLQLFSDIMLR